MILTGPPCKRMEEDMDTVWKGWWKQPSCDGLDHLLQLDEIWGEPKCTIHDTLTQKNTSTRDTVKIIKSAEWKTLKNKQKTKNLHPE